VFIDLLEGHSTSFLRVDEGRVFLRKVDDLQSALRHNSEGHNVELRRPEYRVSMKSFSDYNIFLQENYVEYKHATAT